MDLPSIFKSIGEKLAIDFENISSEIKHNASKGHVRESELVEQFLRKYLPANIGIQQSGEIVSADGQTSNECDIIFFDSQKAPILLDKSNYRIFPIECVYGVMEVKSRLDTSELTDAFQKISLIKRFPKTAYHPQQGAVLNYSKLYDKEWSYFPTVGFVFAYDSIDLTKLKDTLEELQRETAPGERIDSVWILKKGMVVNWDDTTSQIIHTPTAKTRLRAVSSNNPLQLMTLQLQQLLLNGWMPMFNIQSYLKNTTYGNFVD